MVEIGLLAPQPVAAAGTVVYMPIMVLLLVTGLTVSAWTVARPLLCARYPRPQNGGQAITVIWNDGVRLCFVFALLYRKCWQWPTGASI